MTLVPQTIESAVRALGIAGLAILLAPMLARLLAHTHGSRRTLAWALLLAPLFTPALLVSYAYAPVAVRLMSTPGGVAALYSFALTLKLVPVAALILHFVPPVISPEALRCHALLVPARWARWKFRVRAAGRAPWLAGGIVFLLAFTDFELASLWSLKTWTVALFDAQVGGMALSASLRLAALPLGLGLAVLALVIRLPAVAVTPPGRSPAPGRAVRGPLLVYLGGAALLGCGWPLLRVAGQASAGLRAVAENFVLAQELAASVGCAAVAAVAAWLLIAWMTPRRQTALALAVPGLLGALLLSLLLLAAFQSAVLRPAYDTPLPLLLALTLLLLPFALPLRWLLDAQRRDPALHLARLAGSSALVWRLDTGRRWLAAFLLFCWAYFDFTAGSILAPVGLTPVFVRLHNLAHYGQTAVLSAMFLAAFAAPVAVLLLTAPAARWYARR
ncbi:MAG: hypothetical protein K8R23_12620 [Chthoniobacter sp.]|nr:hypothetical protein [Chthoniobacter sp.]